MRRLFLLLVLAFVIVVAWVTRDRWLPMIGVKRPAIAAGPEWVPLSDAGAERTRLALARLSQQRGPVFANLAGADVASYVYQELRRQLPPSTDSAEAAVVGDRLYIRGSVRLSELGDAATLGALAGILADRERVQFGGNFHVIRPGLAEFRLRDVRIRDLTVPGPMIPRIITRIGRGARPQGVSPDGLPLEIPEFIGDIRVANGKLTIYKRTAE
jgi:hypothetical protein